MIEKLQAQDIIKQYNSDFTLECSIEVKKGPLYTIVGPNGSGKSTLLRILGLIEPPDSGKVIYHNEGISLVNPDKDIKVRRKAVLVTTRASLFNETVYENTAYGLRLRKVSKKEVKERVTEALHNVKHPVRHRDWRLPGRLRLTLISFCLMNLPHLLTLTTRE
jgi:tungstate transport system ATP-binding protein